MAILLLIDAMQTFLNLSMAPMTTRSSFWCLVKRLVCAKLYTQFLLVRRQRISELMTDFRGGAVQLPERVLETLLDPKKAMGLDVELEGADETSWDKSFQTLINWIGILLGF